MKPDCSSIEAMLSASLDGELTPDEARACAAHLEACDACRAQHAALVSARAVLRGVPPPQPPPDLLPAIRAAADAEMLGEDAAIALLHAMPAPEPPPDLLPAIRIAVAAQTRRDRATQAFWGRWRTALGVAAAAAVLLAAVFVPRGHEPMTAAGPHITAVAPETPSTPAEPVAAPEEVAEAAPVTPNSVALAMASPRRHPSSRAVADVRPDRAERPEEPAPVAEEVAPRPEPAAPVGEPALAVAPREAPTAPSAAPIAPGQITNGTMLAMAPRTTPAHAPAETPASPVAEAPASPVAGGPSALETELAAGVVARMVVDSFVAEHLIESAPTLMAVVTDSPTAEVGPVLADESEDSANFGLNFTESMRRALSQTHNQLP